MLRFDELKLGLGISNLLPEWKKLYSTKYLLADIFAGITVACVAVPLSLAIALASGVSPGTGLITAIVAGIVCALFGGTTLAVSGPAAAMSVLILEIVQKFGVPSLILIGCMAGIMQLISGMLGIGKLARFVPLPVVSGFTAGIGVIIILGQLPRAFGIRPASEVNLLSIFSHMKEYLHEINGECILLVVITIGIIQTLRKVSTKLPAILIAVVAASLLTYFFDLTAVPLIGTIPSSLPIPELPKLTNLSFLDLFFNAFIIYLLASLETLLSSSAVDKLAKNQKHDPNQELIGQGLGNIIVSLFGGMPITGVIARSATNVQAGAKTRRSSLIHSLVILLTIVLISPIVSAIPIAALSGVLFCVAISMINYKEFINLLQISRFDAIIYVVTFFTIIFVDLLAGIQAGLIAAYIIVLLRASKTHLHISTAAQDDVIRLSLVGALTFLSTGKIAQLQKRLITDSKQTVVMDLSNIRNLDISGTTSIVDLYQYCQTKDIKFFIKGLPRRFESLFRACEGAELLDDCYLVSDHQLRKKISPAVLKSSYGRLVDGIYRFYIERKHNDKRLFEFISRTQDPHTLFITCSDSRIIPSMITSADPGELFIVRNIGNFIPAYEETLLHSEAAAVQFALSSFDITDVVVCGHANCGAIKACQNIDDLTSYSLKSWINKIKTQLDTHNLLDFNEMIRQNVLNQIQNLKTYPLIQQKLADNALNIHGWFFDFDESLIYEWNDQKNHFQSILPQAEMA